jgi:hypothetical protein
MQHLRRLVLDAASTTGRSYREVERASAGLVSKTTLSEIVGGSRRSVTDATVKGIALGYSLAESQVAEAAAKDMKHSQRRATAYSLPERAERLSPAGWKALIAHLDWLLKHEEKRA